MDTIGRADYATNLWCNQVGVIVEDEMNMRWSRHGNEGIGDGTGQHST